MRKLLNSIQPILALATLVAVYEAIRNVGLLSKDLSPSSLKTLSAMFGLFTSWDFLQDVGVTLGRTVLGVLLGGLIGIPLGMIMGLAVWVRKSILPLVDFLRALPAIALFPALTILFGLGEPSKIAAIAIPSALLLTVFAYYACIEVRIELLEFAKLRKYSRYWILLNIYAPSVGIRLPQGLHYALPLGLVMAIVADMFVGAQHGIGIRLIQYQETFKLPYLYATIVTAGLLGYLLSSGTSALLRAVRKRTFFENGAP